MTRYAFKAIDFSASIVFLALCTKAFCIYFFQDVEWQLQAQASAHSRGALANPTGRNRYDAIADCTGSISDATSASACEPLTPFDTGRAW